MYGLRTEGYIYTVTVRHKEPLGEKKPLSPPSTDTAMKGLAFLVSQWIMKGSEKVKIS